MAEFVDSILPRSTCEVYLVVFLQNKNTDPINSAK
jgi:hypothetical protein